MTLGSYLEKHSGLSTQILKSFSSDILKTKIERTLGFENEAANVNWSYLDVATSPLAQEEVTRSVQELQARKAEVHDTPSRILSR